MDSTGESVSTDISEKSSSLEEICLDLMDRGFSTEKILQSKKLSKLLFTNLKNSKDMLIRNLVMPRYITWAPIYFTTDYMVILNYSPKFEGYFLSFNTLDLMVIDADGVALESLIQAALTKYPNDRFHVHKTNPDRDNYHLICVSRPVRYNSREAIQMRYDLFCDVCYAQISLYRGYSVRLLSKVRNREFTYPCVTSFGSGKVDSSMARLYTELLERVREYGKYSIFSFNEDPQFRLKLYRKWQRCRKDNQDSFYLSQLEGCAPGTLTMVRSTSEMADESQGYQDSSRSESQVTFQLASSQYSEAHSTGDIVKYLQRKFCYHCQDKRSAELVDASIRSIQFAWPVIIKHNKNAKRVSGCDEYAICIDVTLNYYFQVFRRFFYVDIDHIGRLRIVYEFAQLHPDYLFWCLPTNKGYHCFLMSQTLDHTSEQSGKLLARLGSDHLYRYNCEKKGYSLRLNRKSDGERLVTRENLLIIGKGVADPTLVKLFECHLAMLRHYHSYPIIACGKVNAGAILEEATLEEEMSE